VSDFLEGLRRHDAASTIHNARQASAASTALQRAAAAASSINKGWADLAAYLAQHGVRTFQYRHFHVNWKHKLMSHYMPESPSGFVVGAQPYRGTGRGSVLPRKAWKNQSSLVLLMPDGRRWHHYDSTLDTLKPPAQGFKDVTPESIVATSEVIIDDDGTIYRSLGYGERELYFDYLGKLAQQMRSPEHCAWLWQ
jgi:hypothetical protein